MLLQHLALQGAHERVVTVRTNIVEGKRQFATLGATHKVTGYIDSTTGASLCMVAYLMTTFWTFYDCHCLNSFLPLSMLVLGGQMPPFFSLRVQN
jgi:hypothetical protein